MHLVGELFGMIKTKAGIPSFENIPANSVTPVGFTELQVTVILVSFSKPLPKNWFLQI